MASMCEGEASYDPKVVSLLVQDGILPPEDIARAPYVFSPRMRLLTRLQDLHDDNDVDDWPRLLQFIGTRFSESGEYIPEAAPVE